MSRKRLPPWFKVKIESGGDFATVRKTIQKEKLNTVCESARCPNLWECWKNKTATFMILGDLCTRQCRFCAVDTGLPHAELDYREPSGVVSAIKKLGIKHAVITSVTRDDLPDGGASVFAEVVTRVKNEIKDCTIEVLIPDFLESLDIIIDVAPDILNHNLETVPVLYSKVRPGASYVRSLQLLEKSKKAGMKTKTGLMVGLGETWDELESVFADIATIDVDILSIGQYLQPTTTHLPIEKFYTPDEFKLLKKSALGSGLKRVESGPKVRSSYHAESYETL